MALYAIGCRTLTFRIQVASIDTPLHATSQSVSHLLTPQCVHPLGGAMVDMTKFKKLSFSFMKECSQRETVTTNRSSIHFCTNGLEEFPMI